MMIITQLISNPKLQSLGRSSVNPAILLNSYVYKMQKQLETLYS